MASTTSSTAVPHYDHIVIVAEENHGYNTIVGSSSAPYINNTLIKGGALLTNDFDNGHPSLPNYLAMYGGSNFGVTNDNTHHEPDPSLYTVLHGAGYSFTGYVDDQGGLTDYDHNPWESFPEGTSVETDWNSGTATFSQLLGNNFANLPAVSFITPNLAHDMHNGTISEGDTWLQNNLGAYATWAQTHNSLLITTWDESETGDQIATILDGAGVAPGTTDGAKYSHYNLLSTVLASEGLAAQAPRNAAGAATYNVFSGGGGGGGGTLAGSTTLSSATEYKALGSGAAIAGFTDTNAGDVASDFTATINWGGTATSAGTISGGNGSFTVSSNHTYHDEGSKALSVAVTRTTDNTSVNLTGTVAVAEADQFSATGTSFSGASGTALTATVANFTDVNAGQVAGDMAAKIGWGDGSNSAGTITGSNGTFQVAGTHTYASSGTDAVSVTITDPHGTATATANSTATIGQGSTVLGAGGTTTPQTAWHYAPNGDGVGHDGFNLADVSSISAADALASGEKGLVWWGQTSGVTAGFKDLVTKAAADSHVYGIYVADEPGNSASAIANIKAEVQYINANAPHVMAFIVADNFGTPQNPSLGGYTPSATGMTASNDLLGLDPYPVRPVFSGGIDLNVIDAGVSAAEKAGWSASHIVPVYQAFGGGGSGGWTLPTGSQEQQIMQEFAKSGIASPAFDYGYTWGLQTGLTGAISTSSALQSVFAAHNSGQF